tara:strand:+ start:334 stop:996 length:663 start_codon:yes stop_codon:yes gene_type:complete
MSISIQEKVDQLTTNLMEVAGIPDTIAGLYNKIDPTTRNILFSDVEGIRKNPGALQNIAFRGIADFGDAARKRGAGEGAAMGAVGGGLLGAGVAGAGAPKIVTDALAGAKGKKGKAAIGAGALGALKGGLKVGLMAVPGAAAGTVGGGLAGFRGGRQTGAAILGAGAAGGPAGLAFGPYAGIAGAIAGGGIGSDIAQSYVRAKKGLQAGGDPYNLVFRQA